MTGKRNVDLFYATEGVRGRSSNTGWPFLDQQERIHAEEARARVEDREPDYDNPGPTAGSVLTTLPGLLATDAASPQPAGVVSPYTTAELAAESLQVDPVMTVEVDDPNAEEPVAPDGEEEPEPEPETTPEEEPTTPEPGEPNNPGANPATNQTDPVVPEGL